jgi:hypothetical protein
MRMGRASDRDLALAAYHEDPAAKLVCGDKLPDKGVETDEDLALLEDLPLQTLNLKASYEITNDGFN